MKIDRLIGIITILSLWTILGHTMQKTERKMEFHTAFAGERLLMCLF